MAKGNPHRAASAGRYGRMGSKINKGDRPATRSRGSRLVDDPDQVEKDLNAQLKAMKLYPSQTSGDGNCLFRALSDQLYGYPDNHARLRQEICDYLAASPERFAGFVDVEKPFDEYVKTMRQNGTYGGHLELSAFASLKKKEIKIVQPGLVYRVTGHDDSAEALAERDAVERQRERMQADSPSGSERPPLSLLREARRRKKVEASRPNMKDSADGNSAGPSSATAETQPQSSQQAEAEGPLEAFGPLYIAYHNWEHYSSVRNAEGPHAGLPRIIESNVSLAAQQAAAASEAKGKARAVDPDEYDSGEEEDYPSAKPTEHEELILRSVPGHTLEEVRGLLRQHGNLWETVVEVLIAQDVKNGGVGRGEDVTANGNGGVGRTTRSRGASYTYHSATPANKRSAQQPIASDSHARPLLPVPEHIREAVHATAAGRLDSAWRGASPASSSGGDATSASTHATTTTTASSSATGDDATSTATTAEASVSPATERGSLWPGIKRAASFGPHQDEPPPRSPKRRSSSREREQEEKSVDGALSCPTTTTTATDAAGDNRSAEGHTHGDETMRNDAYNVDTPPKSDSDHLVAPSDTNSVATLSAASHSGIATPLDSASPGWSSSTSSQPYSSNTFTYSLESSRGRLSPPLSPSLLAKEDLRGLSAKDKREIELKRKRDRQRERRSQARMVKESRTSRTKAVRGAGPGVSSEGSDPAAGHGVTRKMDTKVAATYARGGVKRRDLQAQQRKQQREEEEENEGGRGNSTVRGRSSAKGSAGSDAVPKAFVELRI